MADLQLTPRLLIVPVNTPVLLTCEVRYSGTVPYSVHWYSNMPDASPLHQNLNEEGNSVLTFTLVPTSEYNDTRIHCSMVTNERHNPDTGRSEPATLKVFSKGKNFQLL